MLQCRPSRRCGRHRSPVGRGRVGPQLVDDLERLGYLQRQPDPDDGRAKQIVPTARGSAALAAAGDRVAEIEEHWAQIVGADRFNGACYAMQELLDALNADDSRR